jgi:uncharacterized membrane protein
MSDTAASHHLLVATFADEPTASRALSLLVPGLGHEALRSAAVVVRSPEGKVRFAETHDRTAGQGAIAGAGAGAMAGLVGVLFTPLALLSVPLGAVVGAVVGKMRDTGFDDAELVALGEDLQPNQSALLVDLDDALWEKAERLLAEVDVQRIVRATVDADLATLLDAEVGDVQITPDT